MISKTHYLEICLDQITFVDKTTNFNIKRYCINRAKRTAGHLRVIRIHIVTRNSLKTRRARPLKTKLCAICFDYRTCVNFHVYKAAI